MENGSFALPLLIFVAEVCVVTVGTLRIIFVARGHKFVAPMLGFFEITMWLFAAGVTMKNLDHWQCCGAFALGFTLGSYLGILIEKWLAMGTVVVRIITHRDAAELIDQLRAANFGVTCFDAQGATGKVQMVLTVAKRKHLPNIIAFIETHHFGAFYAIDEVQAACEGVFPTARERGRIIPAPLCKMMRFLTPAASPTLAQAAKETRVDREASAA